MKILVISLYSTYPPTFGAATVTYNLFKYLTGKKFLIQLGKKDEEKDFSRNGKIISFSQKNNSRFRKLIEMRKLIKKIRFKAEEISPNFIILEGASWSLYYLILSKKLRKFKVIYHGHNLEYELRKQKENFIISRLTFMSEKYLLKNSYLSFMVSERDANLAKKLYKIKKPDVLPNGCDMVNFKKLSSRDKNKIQKKYNLKNPTILFMGMPSYKPNKEAIEILCEKIFPRVLKEIPDVKLLIIGGKAKRNENFIINPGIIPFLDVPKVISICDLCVCPIISGSGTRLKILEYMAAKRPVISTSKGVEGLNIKNNVDIILEDNWKKFSDKLIWVLKNEKEREKMGKSAYRFVSKNYDYKKIINEFQNKLK